MKVLEFREVKKLVVGEYRRTGTELKRGKFSGKIWKEETAWEKFVYRMLYRLHVKCS
jgi:hypothetical protein